MANQKSHFVARTRDSFWFLPGVFVVGSIVLAELVVLLDRLVPVPVWAGGFILEIGPNGSRGLLTAIAGSMLGAAATMFSITIAVLALTASNYGPRLVRKFMADRGNQIVLGGLVSIALYALLVVRHVRVSAPNQETFVPHLAVNISVVLLVGGIGLLVYFIHHIATDIQVSTMSTSVRKELIYRLEHQFPSDADAETAPSEDWVEGSGALVRARQDGYVGGVAVDDLVSAAKRHDVRIDVLVQPGTYVVMRDVLASSVGAVQSEQNEDRDQQIADAVVSAIAIEDERTTYQDLEHLVRQLLDLAVRALSPGTNDPFTAINAIDDLSAAFARGIGLPTPSRVLRDDDGTPRVRVPHRRVVELVTDAVDVLRPYAAAHTIVTCRLLLLLRRVIVRAREEGVRRQLLASADRLVAAHAVSGASEFDQGRVREARRSCDAPELTR
jgi:uncharacterized membrane protein